MLFESNCLYSLKTLMCQFATVINPRSKI